MYYTTADHHQSYLRQAEMPYFSYRDYVWPERLSPPRDLWTKWCQCEPMEACHVEFLYSEISANLHELAQISANILVKSNKNRKRNHKR